MKAATTLGPFLTDFTTRRIDVKPATKEVWQQVVRNLLKHFGADRDLASVTEADAEDFKMFLVGQKLASTTVHKRLQFARMFFRAAKKRKLITDNPFAEVTSKATATATGSNSSRGSKSSGCWKSAPIIDWRVIVGLSRFGGLRCPSAKCFGSDGRTWIGSGPHPGAIAQNGTPLGKASREIPIFPELRADSGLKPSRRPPKERYSWWTATTGRQPMAGGWRNCNLRTQFERIVKRAGLQPWPRLFHDMRASRETELAKEYPIHVVTSWLGNTPRIALKHYLQVTDADFERAAGVTGKAAQNAAHERTKAAQRARAAKIAGNRTKQARPLWSAPLLRIRAIRNLLQQQHLAERTGFEPADQLPGHGFSKPALSTTQPPLLKLLTP